MKYDPLVYKVKHYIREGSAKILKDDVVFSIKRHVRYHYIGLSNLAICGRMIWAKYFKPHLIPPSTFDESRSGRIFDLGHVIEDMTLKILIAGGASVSDAQLSFTDFNGVVRGHADSVLDNECILEIKSMNQHSFENFVELGIQRSHPTYYVQMQMYMYYAGLKDAVLVATNKNTCEIECEHVTYDEETVNFHLQKLDAIVNGKFHTINAPYIPETIEECKYCNFKRICHKG